ncbi:MAG: aldehyde dehydrogenase family protein [Chloroflexi bacterium]|nr:aldehyde dehydrogenase family protein [Chloroflexota bacterium]
MAAAERPDLKTSEAAPEQIAVKKPTTGELLGHVPVMSAEDVRQAVERARAAQPAWEALGVRGRAKLLQQWGDLLWARQKEVIQTIRAETGKTDVGAWEEVAVIDTQLGYYVHRAPQILRPQTRRTSAPLVHQGRVYFKPWGVVGFITPWNYPLLNGFQDLLPALLAGNTILLKPSEYTPFTALHAGGLMAEAGIPDDVFQIVTGDGRTGAALVDVVDFVSFTGSTLVGRKVAVRAAERLIPCSLELGGKDPVIVLKDANLDLAAAGTLVGGLENAGQACVSIERVYVEEAVYDRYLERLKFHANRLVVGPGDGKNVHVGSLTNERELLRCEAQIADAVAKGAKIIHGGRRRPDLGPLFYEPTILVDVDHSMLVMQEETFGPIIPVMRVKHVEQAIRLANDSQYGLSGTIFSTDLKRAEQLATRIESGDVAVNAPNWIFGSPSLPMGGVKNSGLGRRQGPEGLLRFVRPQSILLDNQLLTLPVLSHNNPFIINGILILRKLRRRIPLLRI